MPYNTAMSHLQIILPFGIPPAALAPDLLRALQTPSLRTPALAKLLACASQGKPELATDFARLLPHEAWLAGHFRPESRMPIAHASSALTNLTNLTNPRLCSPASTHNKMQELGLTASEGYWFTFSPVHIHIARDHLVLTDQRRLSIPEDEARALFQAAAEMCAEIGKTLLYGDAKTWFLRADDWQHLQTSTMDAACGHNIEIWMPKGEQERAWRKLQNEIQMLWHIHPINAQREASGVNIINSAWLHSGSAALIQQNKHYRADVSLAQVLAASQSEKTTTVLLDHFLEPSINSDWAYWLEAMHTLEDNWFAPALQAIKQRQLQRLDLVFNDAASLTTFTLTPRHLWKFWVKDSLAPLFSLSQLNTEESA
jgi:hypothetical protein